MRISKGRRLRLSLAILTSLAVFATACGGNGGDDGGAAEGEDQKDITIGWIPWDEDIAVTHMWKKILEDKGYNVELTQLDAAPLYAGMAKGDIDLFLDGWLPATHEDYWNQYQDDLVDIGTWYDKASLHLTVPDYVNVDSMEQLSDNANLFEGEITGIESSAGQTRLTKEEVMPTYGLEDSFTLVESSSPAMLTELKKAIDAQEPIVVTIWRPHWAYDAYNLKDLQDPQNAYGDAEQIHSIARAGFQEDFPQLSNWLKGWTMNDEQLYSLENEVVNKAGEGNEAQGVEAWLSENPNFVNQVTGGGQE